MDIMHFTCGYLLIFFGFGYSEARLSITGINVHHVTFYNHKSIVKHSYLAYIGESRNVLITCDSDGRNGIVTSLFKGPWSSPTLLVENNVFGVANVTVLENSTGLTVTFDDIRPEHSGTYYCFTSEALSESQIVERSHFAELFVRTDTSLFCYAHSYTDSIFWSGLTKLFVQCLTNQDDFSHGNVGVYLMTASGNESTELDQWMSSPSSTLVDLAEVIYEVPVSSSDLQTLNNSRISCNVSSMAESCDNIERIRLFTDLEVQIIPPEVNLRWGYDNVTRVKISFLCSTVPKVSGDVTWTLANEGDNTNDYLSMNVSMTTEGSELTLETISGVVVEDQRSYNVTVLCEVRYGKKRYSNRATLTLAVAEGPHTTTIWADDPTNEAAVTPVVKTRDLQGFSTSVTKGEYNTTSGEDTSTTIMTRYLAKEVHSQKSLSYFLKPTRPLLVTLIILVPFVLMT